MQYEFRGKSILEAVSSAVATQEVPALSTKGSDSDSARIRSGGNARLVVDVRPGERYTVEWSARSADEDAYAIEIVANVGLGRHSETFSSSGSWSFQTGSYEGEVTIVVEFFYPFSALRFLDVSVG